MHISLLFNLVLCEFNRCNKNNLAFTMCKRREENLRFLEMLTITASLGQTEFVVLPNDLRIEGARRLMAFRNHRSRTSVESYFFVKYGITLSYPYMPCIVEKFPNNHENYYPIEALNCYVSKYTRDYLDRVAK
jgi:hypothetical protein